MSDDPKAVKVTVTGVVQGVGFRDWTRREAQKLGLTGWVRNETDGSVAALLVGKASAVATMLERLYQGPSHSHVTDVVTEPATVANHGSDFRITQ